MKKKTKRLKGENDSLKQPANTVLPILESKDDNLLAAKKLELVSDIIRTYGNNKDSNDIINIIKSVNNIGE